MKIQSVKHFYNQYSICYFVNLNRILFSDDLLHEGRLKTPT
ncbi:hypothetical protein NEIMUCOT_05208 [Neisseria mucosa ATCC 25996]|uniref:Uncharacterized protein n=1 Tax=Neisseria mucosa (strain ATCC 25996 / DSM 4631 / NCTC 10774 / M26) TaxID=546266 RepID=D2ZX60_NEIM2|nr:hypothetical protein NEIMUCOT_05208 [Neisseria mucosa ATCC 25996]